MARRDDDDEEDIDDEDDDRDSRKSKSRKEPSKEEMQMAMFCHLGGIVGGIILPLVLWLTQKDKSEFIDDQGKEAVNFGITMMIAHMGLGLITCGLAVFLTMPFGLIFHVLGGMAAGRGERYRYPICIRFIT